MLFVEIQSSAFQDDVQFATVEAPVSGPRSGSGKSENLQMQIELLLKTIQQQKEQISRQADAHTKEMSDLKSKFRDIQGK